MTTSLTYRFANLSGLTESEFILGTFPIEYEEVNGAAVADMGGNYLLCYLCVGS
ncbi:MAG TPA: hypothetical protein IGS52_24730 [Oscillatoriaceae cyanobacterium M33_DOE_052]|nr:hypothetical protein [Oscillatoriaceae cyanobacterium M33_DOE_052]